MTLIHCSNFSIEIKIKLAISSNIIIYVFFILLVIDDIKITAVLNVFAKIAPNLKRFLTLGQVQ